MICPRSRVVLALTLSLVALAAAPRGQIGSATDCTPEWLPTFGAVPGFDDAVTTMAIFDDGSGAGPQLHAAGGFTTAGNGSVNRVAKWNGWSWEPVGTGFDQSVDVLRVFDDGGGPALYAGGRFVMAGEVTVNGIAQWDGESWSALGLGVGGTLPYVFALEPFDDDQGGGPALFVGGRFTSAGGLAASRIAKWDGREWSNLGGGILGINSWVQTMAVYDDGDGPMLYAGGRFNSVAPGVLANYIARWNGISWSGLGLGVNNTVLSMRVFDDGGGAGTSLYVGGDFIHAGSDELDANHVARWDGEGWSALGDGIDERVWSLTPFDDGSGAGPQLHAFGQFLMAGGEPASCAARWDGAEWSPLDSGMPSAAYSALVVDAGDGPELFVAGAFLTAGGSTVNRLASWDGERWAPLGGGLTHEVRALSPAPHEGESVVYAAGAFTTAGSELVNRIARSDESGWTPLGSGMNGTVSGLAVDDGENGPVLYAGGAFTTAGGVAASRVARWDGASWSPLGSGMNAEVLALALFDDGSGGGPELYAAGSFSLAGGVSASGIAKWDGSAWSPVGTGLNSSAFALSVFDDGIGGGPALYAAGFFTNAGGVTANRIARWNGANWSALGLGLSGSVSALLAVDAGDSGGPALYAGGAFTTAGGLLANRVARWNGTQWSALGSGVNGTVSALAFADQTLFVGGAFTEATAIPAARIAAWDGSAWTPLGSGTNDSVLALAVVDAGESAQLLAGGRFTDAPDSHDSFLARWACPAPPPVWTDLGFGLAGTLGIPELAGTGTLVAGSPGSLVLTSAKPIAPSMLFISFASVPTPFKGGTLVPVPPALKLGLFTNGVGSIPLAWAAWPAGVPSGASLYFQYAIADPAAPAGVALSNALHAATP